VPSHGTHGLDRIWQIIMIIETLMRSFSRLAWSTCIELSRAKVDKEAEQFAFGVVTWKQPQLKKGERDV
jgi:hypothetical protein